MRTDTSEKVPTRNSMTRRTNLALTLAIFGLLFCVGCSSLSTGTSLVSAVKNGTIEAFPTVPLGKAFDATFSDAKWRSDESDKGVKFVEFTGHFSKDALNKSEAIYQGCAAPIREVHEMPNYIFIKRIGQEPVPMLQKVADARADGDGGDHSSAHWWRQAGAWTDMMRMADENKGNEVRIAELFNSSADNLLLEFFGKIGPGFPNFERFVREAGDITACGPHDGTETTVTFQFQFTPDGKTFSLSYIDMKPWKRINVYSPEELLQYVFK